MDQVAACLTTSVQSFSDRARQERTDELQAIRAQRLAAAEAALIDVQTEFVNRAEAEIRGLQDGAVGSFVHQLAGKVRQYGEEAMATFTKKFTPDQWKHIKDNEAYLRGKLVSKVDAKLQEVTTRLSTLNQNQYAALLAQKQDQERQVAVLKRDLEKERRERTAERERLTTEKQDQERQVAALKLNLETERRERTAERDRLTNEKARAVDAAKATGRDETQREVARVRDPLSARISSLEQTIRDKDAVIGTSLFQRARQNLARAYIPPSGESTRLSDEILDFCLAAVPIVDVHTIGLTSGNWLTCRSSDYFRLCCGGSHCTVGRDDLPAVQLIGNKIRFACRKTEVCYSATPHAPSFSDSSSDYEWYSFFTPENTKPGNPKGPWRIKNTGFSSSNYLRVAEGKIVCDATSENASSFELRPR
jgi:hypothetical protein